MKIHIPLFSTLLFVSIFYESSAQTADTLKNADDSYENQIEAAGDLSEDSDLIESVELLSENPINLNSASILELQKIPNVDPLIAQKIVEFRIENSGFNSLSDLQKIPEISQKIYRSMLPFVKIRFNKNRVNENETGSENEKSKTKSVVPLDMQLRQRSAFDVQNKKAFLENKYEGNKLKIYNRLKANYNNLSTGLVIEKDPGEANYADYINGYFQINELSFPAGFKINKIILGAYQASYGQGLIQWTNSGFGKSASTILSPKRNERGIQPYLSSDENQYFSGVAISINNSNISSTAELFYSSRKYDGKITTKEIYNPDENNNELISYSFDFSGYHRDSSETAKKDKIHLSTFGFNLSHQFDNFGSIGFTGVTSNFNNSPITASGNSNSTKPGIEDYYSGSYRKNSAYSINYDFVLNSVSVYGETAVHNNKAFGISTGLIFRPAKQITYSFHFRKMDSDFLPLMGRPFSEKTSTPANEKGIYHGVEFKSGKLKLNFYYDSYQFPWSTFQNIFPRNGHDWLIFSEYELNQNSTFNFQYKNETVMESYISNDEFHREIKLTGETNSQNLKTQLITNINNQFRLKTRIDYTFYFGTDERKTTGFAFVEQVKYTVSNSGLIIFQYHYFDTPAYNNRIYVYENDLPGLLTSISLYGKGTRLSITSTFDFLPELSISAKIAITKYSDRKVISSGDSEIAGNLLSQVGVQLDWNF